MQISGSVFKTSIVIGFIAVICLYLVFDKNKGDGWKEAIQTDGRGYWGYLPAIFIYQDLNFDFVKRAEATIYTKGGADYYRLGDGKRANKYFVGEAVLLTPFFLLAWFLSWITGNSLDGYNVFFFGSVSIAALFYMIAGLVFIAKLLRIYQIKETTIQIIVILLAFATNIFQYAIYEPSMSHIYSFAVISAFLFFCKKIQTEGTPKYILFSAAALGLIIIIRPVNAIIVLAIPFLTGSLSGFREFIGRIFQSKKYLIPGVLILFGVLSIQLTILYLMYDSFFKWPYRGEIFTFLHPHFIDSLFSYRKGLFIYTPLIFISILFILPYFKKSTFAAIAFIVFFIILNWIISSWYCWYYGGNFGLRAFVEFYPLIIIPMANGLNAIRNKIALGVLSAVLTFILIVNLIQTYQYKHLIMHYSDMDKEKYWKIFLRTNPKNHLISYPYNEDKIEETNILSRKILINNFDEKQDWPTTGAISASEFYSGSHSIMVNYSYEYGAGYNLNYREIILSNINFVKVSFMIKVTNFENGAGFVISFENRDGTVYKYERLPVSLLVNKENDWEPLSYAIRFPIMYDGHVMKIYFWNESKKPIYVDDEKIELISEK